MEVVYYFQGEDMNIRTYLLVFFSAAIGCIVASVFFLSLFGVIFTKASSEPKDISVDIIAPIEAEKDEGFEVEIAITNSANKPKKLSNIDVDLSYLEGIYFHGSEPDFVEYTISEDPSLSNSYWYYLELPENSTLTVMLRLMAREVGDFSGQISVCINNYFNCLYISTRIVVTE